MLYNNVDLANPKGIYAPCYEAAYALVQFPNTSDPVLKNVSTSTLLAAVDNVGCPPGNNIAVESSSVNVAVRDPVPSCLTIKVTVCPVAKFFKLKPVACAMVTVCTGARLQSTVIVVELVKAFTFSLYRSKVPTLDSAVSNAL